MLALPCYKKGKRKVKKRRGKKKYRKKKKREGAFSSS